MSTSRDKVTDLETAIRKYVTNGCHLSIGGFTCNRNPMAAVYEIIRQGVQDLHLYAHSNGQGIDELIGAGCIKKLEIAYGGNGKFAPTCIRFRKAVQEEKILIEDYSNYQMTLRFLAGAMGLPFLPTRSSLGTNIIDTWGFSEEFRIQDPKIPDKKLVVMENPFPAWADTPQVVLLPAINPDVTIAHVQKADREGTVRIKGLTFADVEQAKAARHLILTCEEIVETDALRNDPGRNQIPFLNVDAVVHVPFGAYPTACYGYYDYDPVYLNNYRSRAEDDNQYKQYLHQYILGIKNHQGLLDLVGRERLDSITADPRTGYAVGLNRK